jgi:hypothetical protein
VAKLLTITDFERDPLLNPDNPSCANPPSTVQIKVCFFDSDQSFLAKRVFQCVLWSGPVNAENAVNAGQWRNKFQVVIAGSNGYVNKSIDTPSGYVY